MSARSVGRLGHLATAIASLSDERALRVGDGTPRHRRRLEVINRVDDDCDTVVDLLFDPNPIAVSPGSDHSL
ncbi:MAG: hypothetical protein ACUVSY_07750 [Roseiflexus sp.]